MSNEIDFTPMLKESFSAKGALRASLRYTSEDDQWQTSRNSLCERNKYMFNNELFSDIRFLVGRVDKQSIPAHKYIMSISSPVFSSIFFAFGALQAEQLSKEQIEISECEPAAFLELLRYLYYDEVQLITSTAPEVLFLARKYLIPNLADICTEYIIVNLTVDNTLAVLDHCSLLGVGKGLEKQCWGIVDKCAERIADDVAFVEIDHGTLTAFLSRDTLVVKETTLFGAAVRWSGKECQRLKLPLTVDSRRQALGDAFYSIRFPLMSMKEFTEQVARSGYLTYEEVANMYIGYNSAFQKCHVKFPIKPRASVAPPPEEVSLYRCKRYSGFPEMRNIGEGSQDGTDEGEASVLRFEVDSAVELVGVSLFSVKLSEDSEESEECEVVVQLSDADGQVLSKFEGVINNIEEDSIQEVMLAPKVLLQNGVVYSISASSTRPAGIHGKTLADRVDCEGIGFTFTTESDDEENADNDQIAEIIFCLPRSA